MNEEDYSVGELTKGYPRPDAELTDRLDRVEKKLDLLIENLIKNRDPWKTDNLSRNELEWKKKMYGLENIRP